MKRFFAYLALASMFALGLGALTPASWLAADWFLPLLLASAATPAYLLARGRVDKRPAAPHGPLPWCLPLLALAASVAAGFLGWAPAHLLVWLGPAAMAEELAFRYLPFRLGAGLRPGSHVLIALSTTAVFTVAHPLQDPWLIADRALFGLGAYALCVLSGSWLAAGSLHMISNLLTLALPGLGVSAVLGPAVVLLDVALLLLFLWMAHRYHSLQSSLTPELHRNTI